MPPLADLSFEGLIDSVYRPTANKTSAIVSQVKASITPLDKFSANTTIYASYIEQFWNTATSKIVNSVKQIHAIVDGKAVVISESSVRSDLLFDDEDGITCLTNDDIFENLALMAYKQLSTKLTFQKGSFSPEWKFLIHTILHCISSKSTGWNEFSTNLASAVICLAKGQKFNFSKLIFDGMLRNLDPKKFLMYPRFLQLFLNNQLKDLPEPFNDTYETPSHTKKVFSNMARQSKSFSGKVTPLFESMLVQNQAPEGESSVTPPEPQPTPSTSQPNVSEPQTELLQTETPPTVSHEPQTEANIEQILPSPSIYQRKHRKTQKHRRAKKVTELPQTSYSKERKIRNDLDLDLDLSIFLLSFPLRSFHIIIHYYKDFEELDDHMENVEEETVDAVTTGVSTAAVTISTAEPRTPPSSTTIFDDENVTMAMARTLIKMKEHKAKEKGVAITDVEDSSSTVRPIRSITTLQPLPNMILMTKVKVLLVKEELSNRRKRGSLTLKKEHNFCRYNSAQRKFRAAQRAAEIRSKPPTRTQLRNLMITYLKNTGGYKYSQLKGKTYEEIHGLYERQQKRNQDFIPMDTEVINDSGKKNDSSSKPAGGSRKKTLAKKRAGEKKSEESAKKQKLEDVAEEQESAKSDEEAAADYEHEKEELRMWLTVVSDEEETVDPKILSAKYPIVDWESQNLGSVDMEDLHVYKIIRADGNTSYHKSLSSMLSKFDRQDLVDLHRLVMKRFKDTTPEGYNLLLREILR
ncbi:hypothetical protein Tco_1407560 [Tanacetum coccineum]